MIPGFFKTWGPFKNSPRDSTSNHKLNWIYFKNGYKLGYKWLHIVYMAVNGYGSGIFV